MVKFNSLDIAFILYSIWQMYAGYIRGIEHAIYNILKWIVIIVGIYISNKFIWGMLEEMPKFIEFSKNINEMSKKFLMQFAPENYVSSTLYKAFLETIAFDKIAFYIIIILIVVTIAKILVYGSIVSKEPSFKLAGLIFGLAKSVLIFYIILTIMSKFMNIVDPTKFAEIQDKSFILSLINYKF